MENKGKQPPQNTSTYAYYMLLCCLESNYNIYFREEE